MKYFIPIRPEILDLCEYIQGGPIPMVYGLTYLIVNTDPDLKYKVGVVPATSIDPKSNEEQIVFDVVD